MHKSAYIRGLKRATRDPDVPPQLRQDAERKLRELSRHEADSLVDPYDDANAHREV